MRIMPLCKNDTRSYSKQKAEPNFGLVIKIKNPETYAEKRALERVGSFLWDDRKNYIRCNDTDHPTNIEALPGGQAQAIVNRALELGIPVTIDPKATLRPRY